MGLMVFSNDHGPLSEDQEILKQIYQNYLVALTSLLMNIKYKAVRDQAGLSLSAKAIECQGPNGRCL